MCSFIFTKIILLHHICPFSAFPFCGLFYDPVSIQDCAASDGRMTDEQLFTKYLEERGYGLIKVLSRHLTGGTEESHRTASVPTEIQTRHLPNTNIECNL
jgi:hypothetical protein